MTDDADIETARMRLSLLTADTLRALIAGDLDAASRHQGVALTEEFPIGPHDRFLRVQLNHIEQHPDRRAWCARVMVLRETDEAVGHCGFHGPPEVVGRAEIGYTVFEAHRGNGLATEAAQALVSWAGRNGASAVFASVSPSNDASLAVVGRAGFRQTGTQIDAIDGKELVFQATPG